VLCCEIFIENLVDVTPEVGAFEGLRPFDIMVTLFQVL
jgi:hypothetical protein